MTSKTDVILLTLNEAYIASESVRRLQKEGHNIIVVDNGSDIKDKEIWKKTKDITLVDIDENHGASVGRNAGIAFSGAPYVFLLDGDILYIPGTIAHLEKIIDALPQAGCVGVHNLRRSDGTMDRNAADILFNPQGTMYKDVDIAWTQYGLFRGDLLRECKFVTEGAFGEAGNGYEDDWLWQDMESRGYHSYYLPDVLYYHDKHGGQNWLDKKDLSNKNTERYELFKKHWHDVAWHDKRKSSPWLEERLLPTLTQ